NTERHAPHDICVPAQGAYLAAGAGVPDPDRAIEAGGSDPATVRAEGHAPDLAGVSSKGPCFLARGGVPDLHGLIKPGHGQPLALQDAAQAVDTAGLASQGEEFLAGVCIPDFDLSRILTPMHVGPSRSEALAVRTEGHAPDRDRVPLEAEGHLAALS